MKKIYYLLEIQVFGKTYLSNCIAKEILDNTGLTDTIEE